jgi:putative serine protease PepD
MSDEQPRPTPGDEPTPYGDSAGSADMPAWVAPPAVPVRQQKQPQRALSVFGTVLVAALTALVVGLVAGVGGFLVGRELDGSTEASSNIAPVSLPQVTGEGEARATTSIAGIAKAVLPSVVSIQVESGSDEGSGSGFIIREDGYILTNHHVANIGGGKGTITVVFPDGTKASGRVVGSNSSYDLAVVKVNRTGLTPLALGDSAAAQVGDPVIAIGAPLGLDGTVTTGIVSALDRPVTAGESNDQTSYINAIQTDAAINPGNSGGPLLDSAGRVIGVNSAIATMGRRLGGEAGSIGLGFAIPINTAKRITEELIATGTSSTPIIGVVLDMTYDGGGAKVREVNAGGPAKAGGIQVGDVITSVNGRMIDDGTELVVAIRTFAPGEVVTVGYERNGRTGETNVTLGKAAG